MTTHLESVRFLQDLLRQDLPRAAALSSITLALSATAFPFALIWSTIKEARTAAQRARAPAPVAQCPEGVRIGPRVVIPDNVLPQHILCVGGTGAGKSQVLRAAALHARKMGAPAIIPAVEDSLFQALYDPDRDTILCPWDARSVDWSPLAEVQNVDTDPALLASCLIKKANGESETWAAYARVLLSAMIKKTVEEGGSMADLLRLFKDEAALAEAMEDMAGESLLREGNERMMGSVIGTADAGATILRDVARDLTADEGWSVRRWVDEQVRLADSGKPAGFLWILLGETVRDKMEPIVTVTLAIATRALLSSSERPARRFFMLVDEVSTFPALPSFQSALARGRKYGLSVWFGLQGISQMQETYGPHGAASLLACLSSQVLFRTADAESGKWASDLIGTRHLTRTSTSKSTSEANAMGQGGGSSTSTSEQHAIEHAVLPSEIAGLPDLRAYVRISGRASNVLLTQISYIP
ncbi:type IV secretion system DNA-binding domain-containing protein, partial [Acidiferrobacter sp.]|uniref:type IV secretion system DNA-binding domain-containing protein n=1 Tax=Acidiferrobacter sp. TaxID=1872107 RepID=UPI0026153803